LAVTRTALGKDHPDYVAGLKLLAELLWARGYAEEAEPLYREALAVVTASFGAEHPSSKFLANDLHVLEDEIANSLPSDP
jgi:hypothetical protein